MSSMIDLCFMCSNDNNCNVVDNKTITKVEYLMPEITIIKLMLPLRFCSICEKNLELFSTFKKDCVENSRRLETWIKEAQDYTDVIEKCTPFETNINKFDEVCIKEEVLDESDNLEVKYSLVEEISIKEDPLQENPKDRDLGDVLQDREQDILKDESPPQTDTHFYEDSSVDMKDKSDKNYDDPDEVVSDKNYDDPDEVVSDNNDINFDENVLVTVRPGYKIYTCLICKKDFRNLWYSKIHMKLHLGKINFQCVECKKRFLSRSHLNTHIKQHTGVKKFQCIECKKCFSIKSRLTAHMKRHTGVKEYQCNECKKWFVHKSSLARHKKQHTGVKDYQCIECKKMFSQKGNLALHMRLHTGVKEFQCSKCKKWFTHKTSLARHMKLHT